MIVYWNEKYVFIIMMMILMMITTTNCLLVLKFIIDRILSHNHHIIQLTKQIIIMNDKWFVNCFCTIDKTLYGRWQGHTKYSLAYSLCLPIVCIYSCLLYRLLNETESRGNCKIVCTLVHSTNVSSYSYNFFSTSIDISTSSF
jgi:hypothetical protein